MLKKILYLLKLSALSLVLTGSAYANDGTMIGILCQAYGVFAGPLGQALAIFAIVALGIGLFMGKITWGLVFAVALGIGAIFGAPKIAKFITGDDICASVVSTGERF